MSDEPRMRAVRATLWRPGPDPSHPIPALSPVVLERDLNDTIESFLAGLYANVWDDAPPEIEAAVFDLGGAFVTHEIRDFPEREGNSAVMAASVLMSTDIGNERERQMAVLYFWAVQMLGSLKDDGVLATKDPAPLSAQDIDFVLNQVIQHPNYERQTIVVLDRDGARVSINE